MGLRRILATIPSIRSEVKKFPQYTKNFGIKIALLRIYDTIWPRTQKYMDAVYSYISDWCDTNLRGTLVNSINSTIDPKNNRYVWTCWWQGKENMPEVVDICISQMHKMLPSSITLQLITLQNYKQYVDIPDTVVQKYETGLISAAAFSDILRYALLNRWGGMWIDSTVFLTEHISEDLFEMPLFTQKDCQNPRNSMEVSEGRWCNFVIGGHAANALFRFMSEALICWWEKNDNVLDYILPDYLIKYAYNNFEEVKNLLDQVPMNNAGIWNLYNKLNAEYSTQIWETISQESIFHKLTYKKSYCKYTPENTMTIYGYISPKNETEVKEV